MTGEQKAMLWQSMFDDLREGRGAVLTVQRKRDGAKVEVLCLRVSERPGSVGIVPIAELFDPMSEPTDLYDIPEGATRERIGAPEPEHKAALSPDNWPPVAGWC